jgi:uncharacterized membrane protein (UPF0127 family)
MSNKTQKANAKKIRWALSLTLLATIVVAGVSVERLSRTATSPLTTADATCSGLLLHGVCMPLERATTESQRVKGLSGRDNLPANSGLLFVYERPNNQCFWMKDMKFSIDMVFVDSNKRIIKIYDAVEPSTYPKTFCADNAQYVLEFNAGFAQSKGLSIGQALQF